ncbi:MAG: recombination protein RecR [Calditrichaeota bacterium]|nr:recombination protein RecR [Calditrichota bacterium]
MDSIPQALQQLIGAFSRLPGIGRKTATRLAFHILKADRTEAEQLARALMRVKTEIRQCSICFNITESDPCAICRDPNRDRSMICVVEDAQNILLIERTNEYRGLYHVLGGVISPLDGVGPEDLHIKELLERLQGVKEVILALNPSTEGEATAIYLARLIKPMGIKITRLARGVPLGSSLEFVDELTLGKALQSRSEL